jgi:hypothetical protein
MIPIGLCQCGCGEKTTVDYRGNPYRFCHGHYGSCGVKQNHPKWNGGTSKVSKIYETLLIPNHPRAMSANGIEKQGYVRTHLLLAEKALGRPIPTGNPVHHHPCAEEFTDLVICQDHAYHLFIHRRYRAFKACGNVHWTKCVICKQYDDPSTMVIYPHKAPFHLACRKEYRRMNYQQKNHHSNTPLLV